MRNRALLVALCLLAAHASGCVTTPKSVGSESAAAAELASIALEDGGYDFFLDVSTDVALQAARGEIEASLGREMTMREGEGVQGAFHRVLRSFFPQEKLVELFASIYASEFTREELVEIVAFARTAPGRKAFGHQSQIQRAATRALEQEFSRRREVFVGMIDAELRQVFGGSPGQGGSPTIAESRQRCASRDADPSVPYYCIMRDTEEGLVMLIGFEQASFVEDWWPRVADELADPFCAVMNSGDRRGFVFLIVSDINAARGYSCETGELSHWFPWRDDPQM